MANAYQIVGHRGWPERFPENTLPGLVAAAQSGAHAVELDVQLTKDRVCVVLHDPDLTRVAGDGRHINELTLAQLAGISVHEQARLGRVHYPTPVATLAQVCEALAKEDLSLFIELKEESLGLVSEQEFVSLALEQSIAAIKQRVLISFSDTMVDIAKNDYGARTGWVLSDYCAEQLARLATLSPDVAIIDYKKIPQDTRSVAGGNWSWFVYDVVDKNIRDWCVDIGITYIETWDIAAVLAR